MMAEQHDDLKGKLMLRMGAANALAAHCKSTAERLSDAADQQERGHLYHLGELRKQIRAAGVGADPEAEEQYCQLLMARHRLAQAGQLAERDAQRFPDVPPSSMRKGLGSAGHAFELIGRWYAWMNLPETHARAAANEGFRAQLADARQALSWGPRPFIDWLTENAETEVGRYLSEIAQSAAQDAILETIPEGPSEESPAPLEAPESEGEALQQADSDYARDGTNCPAFREWFAESVVVGPEAPLVVYPFAASVAGEDGKPRPRPLGPGGEATYGPGFYFTDSVAAASNTPPAAGSFQLTRDLEPDDLAAAERYLTSQAARNVHGDAVDDALARVNEGPAALQAWLEDRAPGVKADLLGVMLASWQTVSPEEGAPYGVYLRITKPWDADAPITADFGREFLAALPITSPMREYEFGFDRATMGEFYRHMARTPADEVEFQETLRRLGYDGISALAVSSGTEPDHRMWIVWSPAKVKAVANFGSFDPCEDIYKGRRAEWVPPDMPRWEKGPIAPGALLPLNGVEDRNKFGQMLDTMRAGSWTWDRPLVRCGEQLITGSHRYNAARAAGLQPPTVTLDSVFREAGLDFRTLWRENAVPLVSWVSNLCAILPYLPPELVEKYGIDLG
jgi:hypothetical protein